MVSAFSRTETPSYFVAVVETVHPFLEPAQIDGGREEILLLALTPFARFNLLQVHSSSCCRQESKKDRHQRIKVRR